MTQDMLTHQVAVLGNVSPDLVRWWDRTGKLRARRVGHIRIFDRRDVDAFLRQRGKRETRAGKER